MIEISPSYALNKSNVNILDIQAFYAENQSNIITLDIRPLYTENQPKIEVATSDISGAITALAAAQEAERLRNQTENFYQLTNDNKILATEAATQAQLWAEGEEPGGPGTRSAKAWAESIPAIGADVKTLFGSKQDTLVPGVTLKTINGVSLLGAGDLSVSGPAGSSSVRVKAGADIGGHRVVTLDEQGRAVYASPALMRDVNRVLGLTMHAAVTDADIDVLRDGDAVEPSWSWDLSKPIYLGQDGTLVQQIAPESTFTLIVGFPISATKMYFSIGTSIINS